MMSEQTDAQGAARFRALFDQAGVGIKQVALDGRLLAANDRLCQILGYEREELLGRSVAELTQPADWADEERLIRRLRDGEIGTYTIAKRHLRRDGRPVWVRVTSVLARDPSTVDPYYVSVVEDIDGQVTAEHTLLGREAEIRTILETSPDAIVIIDAQGRINAFSKAAERLFGYTAAEVMGSNVSRLMPSPYREEHDSYLARYERTGERRIIGIGRIVVGLRRDGGVFPMELAVGELPLGDRRMFTGFIRDLTERQKAEKRVQDLQAELLHVSRVSMMGQLSSALAHEINQPLAAIGNYLQAARRMLATADPPAAPRIVEIIEKAAAQTSRAGEVIRSLRSFIEKGETATQPEPLHQVIEEASALAFVGLGAHKVDIRFEMAPDLPPALIDKVPVQQVIVNLLRNAIEAMHDSPRREILIRTSRRADRRIAVEIADTGPGLPADIRDQLFQPFVTTKKTGMGLGLSICRSIVHAHGGAIRAEVNARGGTSFVFDLPAAEEAGDHAG